MKNITVACNTLRDEVRYVIKDLEVKYPVLWIESGLHNTPEKLRSAIQGQIDRIENVDNIILLFGSCGNSLVGLKSDNTRIIFPQVADCISMFLGGDDRKRELDKIPSYYFTRGYLENEANIWSEYQYCVEKYGAERSLDIYKKMLRNYKNLRVIDTGAYKPEEIMDLTGKIAGEFKLFHEVVEGSLKFIYKAFREEWDEDFVIVEPGHEIDYHDVGIFKEGSGVSQI